MKLASAPVTWGVWEKTIGRDDLVPAELLLDTMSHLGYTATELGPPGYFSPELLAQHGMALVGGFAPLRFEDERGFDEDVVTWLDPVIDVLAATGARGPVVLAGAEIPSHPAPDASYFERVNRAVARCRSRDVPVVFHHHAGTYVESPPEIDALLASTDVGVCYDSGHALAGGGDPLDVLRMCRDRIEHVHLKDVDPVNGAFCPFGEGAVDFDAVLAELDGYDGWTVLEQDRVAVRVEDLPSVRAVEASNLELVRSRDGHSH